MRTKARKLARKTRAAELDMEIMRGQAPCVIFDCHPNYLGRGAGAGNQPIAQLLDPRAAMRNGSLAQSLSAGVDQAT